MKQTCLLILILITLLHSREQNKSAMHYIAILRLIATKVKQREHKKNLFCLTPCLTDTISLSIKQNNINPF